MPFLVDMSKYFSNIYSRVLHLMHTIRTNIWFSIITTNFLFKFEILVWFRGKLLQDIFYKKAVDNLQIFEKFRECSFLETHYLSTNLFNFETSFCFMNHTESLKFNLRQKHFKIMKKIYYRSKNSTIITKFK